MMKRWLLAGVLGAALSGVAHELDGVMMGDADRERCLYAPGEKMTFTFGFKAVEKGLDSVDCARAWLAKRAQRKTIPLNKQP